MFIPSYMDNPSTNNTNYMGNSLAAMSMISGLTGAFGAWQRSRAQGYISNANSYIAGIEAQDALNRGQFTLAQNQAKTNQFMGSQKAALAAQGIRTDSGSALDVQQETQDIGALDALTIKNNALRDAFGYNVRALSDSTQGKLVSNAYLNEGVGSLLTGGMRAVDYYSWRYR